MHRVLKERDVVNDAVLGLDIGCALLAWNFLPINTFQTHHGRVTPVMMGAKNARPESVAIGYTGDGGAYAIGWQYLCHAVRRDDPIMIVVINNTLYGMTGGQTAPTSLQGQVTSTDLTGVTEKEFFGPEFLRPLASPDAFIARTAVNNPAQMMDFYNKALDAQKAGHFSLIEILSFCPTNWGTVGAGTLTHLNDIAKVFKTGEIKK
jgi:2-oxoglutarate ferredoxin oxidoreductase subunit beta